MQRSGWPANPDGRSYRVAWLVASAVFALALPIFLIAGNVRSLVMSKQTYDYNWWRNSAEASTGLTRQQLDDAGRQFRDYFENDARFLDLSVEDDKARRLLLNQREILHMSDVKELVHRVNIAEWVAGAVVISFVGAGFATRGRRFWPALRTAIRYSVFGSAAVVGVVALAAVLDFPTTFTIFHEISFANDYWKLAYRDFLILMWPQPFWFEASLLLIALTALELWVITATVNWARRRYFR